MNGQADTSADASWTSSSTIPEIASWLRGSRRITVLTHIKPDGDAIGSTTALVRAIRHARAATDWPAVAWYSGPLPTWFASVVGDTPNHHLDGGSVPPPGESSEPDRIVIADCGAWTQLEPVAAWLKTRSDRCAIIDHHRHGDGAIAHRRVIDTAAAAAAQPVCALCVELLGCGSPARLPRDVAEPLYLGLATDTGWFRHSNVNGPVLRLAADLLDAGVDHSSLYQRIEQQDRSSRPRLMGRALNSMELHDGDRIAVMSLSRADFHECHAAPGDAFGFAEAAQGIATVRVVAMLTESEPDAQGRPVTKISMRSKESPDAPDVNAAARVFGGGGHVRAAGARVQAPMADARRQVIETLTRALKGLN